MVNRVEFSCTFHDQPALGRLTFHDDGTFRCAFLIEAGRVVWPFQGRWTRINETVLLVTPHQYVEVVLRLNEDGTLSYCSHQGGFIRWNLDGARSTPLRAPLTTRAANG